jgi:hypothetical protein
VSRLVAAHRTQRGQDGGGDGDPGNEVVALAVFAPVIAALRGMLDGVIVRAMYVKVSSGHRYFSWFLW